MARGGLLVLALLSCCLPLRASAATGAFQAPPVTGPGFGSNAAPFVGGCFEIGVDYPGNDIKRIEGGVVGLPQLCQALCAETPDCDLFTWDSRSANCYLKRINALDYRQRDASTALLISGPKECNSSYYGVCLEFNVDYEGHDIEQISDNNVFSAAHCQLLCEQKPSCYFFTWQSLTRTCYLKGPMALLGRKTSTDAGLIVSGPKKCWIGTPEKNLCFEYGVDYYGCDIDNLQTFSRETPEHCQLACQQEPRCHYWSWEPTATGNHCFLKGKDAPRGRKIDFTTCHFVSGPKTCTPRVCFERDVDYVGADLRKIEDGSIPDAAACQRVCAQTSGCNFFTYVPLHRWCYLKGDGALLGWKKDEQSHGSISGPRECMNPHANSTCYEPDVSYEGHTLVEIENGKVTSASMCQQFCAHYGLCTHWTWDSQRFFCYLRSASALLGWKKDQTTRGFVSGPKSCHQVVLAGCQEDNFDYAGYDIAKYEDGRVRNPATCQTLCQVTVSCAYWTYVKQTQSCYLKEKRALEGRKEESPNLGLASGPKFCSVAPPGCFEIDVDYAEHNIAKLESGRCSSAPICQSLCQKTTGCAYFTWVSATKSCYLKDTDAIQTRRSDFDTGGMVSGPAFCPRQPACTENGVDFTGYDVGKIEDGQITSPETCRSLCQHNMDCRYWSWVGTTRSCYLKNKYALLARREDASTREMVSGPKYCCQFPPVCYERGYTYDGHDIIKIETGSVYAADTCRGFCQSNPDCFFWTYDKSTRNCYLKDQYAPLGRRPSPYAISGSYECGNRSAGSCVEEGVTYEGRDLLGPSASATKKFRTFGDQYNGALICQAECHATPGCHYWSFDRAGQRCFLKDEHALGGRIRNLATKHFISGHKNCVPQAADCHELDVDYRGFDFRKIETQQVFTYQMCQGLCRATDGCHFWTWDGRTRNCYLKTEQAVIGRVRDHTTQGLISGPKHCQMTVSCFETDVDYTGYTLQQLENGLLQTAAQCQAVCKLRPRCEYWTWNSASKTCYLKTAGAINGRRQNSSTTGLISGARCCTTSSACYEVDTDYFGNDVQKIENGSISSAGECQHLCQLHPDCYYFTYLTDLHYCYLKSFGAAANKVAQVSAVSGPKSCSFGTYPLDGCSTPPAPGPPAGCPPILCPRPPLPPLCPGREYDRLPPPPGRCDGFSKPLPPPPCQCPKPFPPPPNADPKPLPPEQNPVPPPPGANPMPFPRPPSEYPKPLPPPPCQCPKPFPPPPNAHPKPLPPEQKPVPPPPSANPMPFPKPPSEYPKPLPPPPCQCPKPFPPPRNAHPKPLPPEQKPVPPPPCVNPMPFPRPPSEYPKPLPPPPCQCPKPFPPPPNADPKPLPPEQKPVPPPPCAKPTPVPRPPGKCPKPLPRPPCGCEKPLLPPSKCPQKPKPPEHAPPGSNACFEYDIVYVAETLPNCYKAANVAECHNICTREKGARSFTYNTLTSECVLKTVSPQDSCPLFSRIQATGFISGPRDCPEETLNPNIPGEKLEPHPPCPGPPAAPRTPGTPPPHPPASPPLPVPPTQPERPPATPGTPGLLPPNVPPYPEYPPLPPPRLPARPNREYPRPPAITDELQQPGIPYHPPPNSSAVPLPIGPGPFPGHYEGPQPGIPYHPPPRSPDPPTPGQYEVPQPGIPYHPPPNDLHPPQPFPPGRLPGPYQEPQPGIPYHPPPNSLPPPSSPAEDHHPVNFSPTPYGPTGGLPLLPAHGTLEPHFPVYITGSTEYPTSRRRRSLSTSQYDSQKNQHNLYDTCYVIAIEYGGTNLPVGSEDYPHDGSSYSSQYGSSDSVPYVKATSPEDCQKHCAAHSECFYWTFEVDTQRCHLKGADAVKTGVVNVRVVSGPKYCA